MVFVFSFLYSLHDYPFYAFHFHDSIRMNTQTHLHWMLYVLFLISSMVDCWYTLQLIYNQNLELAPIHNNKKRMDRTQFQWLVDFLEGAYNNFLFLCWFPFAKKWKLTITNESFETRVSFLPEFQRINWISVIKVECVCVFVVRFSLFVFINHHIETIYLINMHCCRNAFQYKMLLIEALLNLVVSRSAFV